MATGSRSHRPRALQDSAHFLERVAHDIRSPLGVIATVFQRLRADLDAHLPPDDRMLLSLAERGVRRLQGSADRMSIVAMLARSETPSISRDPLNLVEIAAVAVSATLASSPRREVQIDWTPPESGCPVIGDRWLLEQALRELVQNGVAHAKHSVRVRVSRNGALAYASVEDDGPGAPAEVRDALQRNLVEPLRSARGVGLSLAVDLAELHGGRISYDDSTLPPGRSRTLGARFLLTLPV